MWLSSLLVLVASSTVLAIPAPTITRRQNSSSDLGSCPGYAASNVVKTDSSLTADLTLAGSACNVYSDDLQDLKLLVEYQSDQRLHVKVYDAGLNVFQVQESIIPRPKSGGSSSSAALQFDLVEKPFSFTVKRKENGEVLFDTSAAQLVFETQYVRLRTKLPDNPNLYGLGEHSDSFRLTTQNYQRVLWNTESPNLPKNTNLYGTHPVYFDHRGDKGTHGVFLLNSNGMNVNINNTAEDGQYLEYNTVGGIIDLYFLAGKQPADVSSQYAEVVGHSAMFPYWTFGFHQCKYGYWDVNMVAEVVGNYSTAGIPLEVMWTDIDYMDLRQDFTEDPERFDLHKMRELVDTLHSRDQRYVLILDPGIHYITNYTTYTSGHEQGVFLKAADGSDWLGSQWAGVVAWPDWFAQNTQQWWSDQFSTFYNADTGIDIDGIWVDMNEASNFCDSTTCNPYNKGGAPIPTHPPRPNTGRPIPGFPADFQPSGTRDVEARRAEPLYPRQSGTGSSKGLPNREWFFPKYHINSHNGDLPDFTIFTNLSNADGTMQYDTHNFYGHMMAHTTQATMLTRRPELRPFVLTRSTFAGSGRKVTHWFGDNASDWEHYRVSIRQMLAFVSMHQMPMVGSDVCGFNGDADEFMCARWALLGAFQPFYRNHAELSSRQQEFYQWPRVAEAGKKAIDTRYKLMDYAYTALYYQTTDGTPMINPVFFLYPNDENTFGIQEQWFYGDALLVSPVTTDYSDTVTIYFPEDTFYDYWTYEKVVGQGQNVTRSGVQYNEIPVHIRGGTIIPQRANSANTTKLLRQQDFVILVAPGSDGNAKGRLYLDDGESIEQPAISEIAFAWDGKTFSCTGSFAYGGAQGESITVDKVIFLGLGSSGAGGNGTQTGNGTQAGTVEKQGPWKLDGEFSFTL
ncbi:glycoside hydrolase family 31 protein [Lophiostoma macrostomum CBS 122681]|uniref:alpha-glucosidase n=1 Tax=Lophiostoma macrostomum CBS 122681 TaxID=1314788 RepID=A0A6A6T5B5_9PLEO|nr:glycoside hydrolase family 31 protein [Lophiostoma macrostomum CBS 122681]